MGVFIDNSYILGMGKVDNSFIVLLNIDKILSEDELSVIDGI